MKREDAETVVFEAMQKMQLSKPEAPKLLSDNGPCFIPEEFKKYLGNLGIHHIRG
jgi:hypothetical protein